MGDFQIENGVLVKYTGPGGDVVIPAGVTTIGRHAFQECAAMTALSIPDTVTAIESNAFHLCRGLTSLTIPDSVTFLGQGAFRWCEELTHITLPAGITAIRSYTFSHCPSLRSVHLPDGVTRIDDGAFFCCESLTTVSIPGTVTFIGDFAFHKCRSLTGLVLPEGIYAIGECAFSGCKNLADGDGLVVVRNVLHSYHGSGPDLIVPPSITAIAERAFLDCGCLTRLSIPEKTQFPPALRRSFRKMRLKVLRAPGRPLHFFEECRKAAAIGYAELVSGGKTFSEALEQEYRDYIRQEQECLYPDAIEYPALLRYMMTRRLLSPEDTQTLLRMADEEQKIELKMELLEYTHTAFPDNPWEELLTL